MSEELSRLIDLVAAARRAGADAADAVRINGRSLSLSWRLGRLEDVERAEESDLGLRVLIGKRQAVLSTNDHGKDSLARLVERAVAMAQVAPEDPYCGLADGALLAKSLPELDLCDPVEPGIEALTARAAECEDAARAVAGVTNSEGAGASWGRSEVMLATSHGFAGAYRTSSHGVSVAVIAGSGTAMERDYEFSSARHGADLDAAAQVGRKAGERTVRRLGPSKIESRRMPVVFDPRVSMSLVGHFAGAVSGPAVARGTSFLKDRMGQRVFAPGIHILDEPHRRRGLASKPVDGEGVANRRQALVEDGVLKTWVLDSASARQLGLTTTGHAARGISHPPGPATTNLYLEPGAVSPEALMADIDEGLYVTEMMGFGVNPVTGDYSRGAAGFRIRRGQLDHPVSEMTIAGNLKDMFLAVRPADDLKFRYGTNAPTLRVDGMTVAGR
ncbi:MAG: TldD/PmbA family protein [Alphaproteobacteria bacterium]|nr:TldD/PmbA family protein [Alphaproteobacteria bacterium]